MPWLIDADTLYKRTEELEKRAREKLKEELLDKTDRIRWMAILSERSAFKYDIQEAVTVDAVPVVRCKDCKHRDGSACDYSAVWVRPNGFCHWGERIEDDETD